MTGCTLHHEDFTGQYGKFWAQYNGFEWYRENQARQERVATELGFSKVSQLKLAVAKKIKEYIVGGGFSLPCVLRRTFTILRLSAEGIDICERMFDGDPMDADPDNNLISVKRLHSRILH
ncbi:MAG: hypothetical protein U0T81_00380 [Saprospiraceae bacterium]